MPPKRSYDLIELEVLSKDGKLGIYDGNDPILKLPSEEPFDSLLEFLKKEGITYEVSDSFSGRFGKLGCLVEIGSP